jgi:hypothetical protein
VIFVVAVHCTETAAPPSGASWKDCAVTVPISPRRRTGGAESPNAGARPLANMIPLARIAEAKVRFMIVSCVLPAYPRLDRHPARPRAAWQLAAS